MCVRDPSRCCQCNGEMAALLLNKTTHNRHGHRHATYCASGQHFCLDQPDDIPLVIAVVVSLSLYVLGCFTAHLWLRTADACRHLSINSVNLCLSVNLSVCKSVCLYLAYLANLSHDRLCARPVCCTGPENVHRQV